MTRSKAELAAALVDVAQLTGTFTLRSGLVANDYFDKYQFEAQPALLREIAAGLVALVPQGTEILAGLELGGVPIATALSFETELPTAFVRKQAKEYGTAKLAEGTEVDGRHVLVVEDVVTTGGQLVTSIGELRDLGAVITTAVCVIDREQGGSENLAELGVELRPLFTRTELEASG